VHYVEPSREVSHVGQTLLLSQLHLLCKQGTAFPQPAMSVL